MFKMIIMEVFLFAYVFCIILLFWCVSLRVFLKFNVLFKDIAFILLSECFKVKMGFNFLFICLLSNW